MAAMLALWRPIGCPSLGPRLLRPWTNILLTLPPRLTLLLGMGRMRFVLAFFIAYALPRLSLPLVANAVGLPMVIRIAADAVARRGTNLKLIEFVPLGICAIPIRDGQQLANTATGVDGLRIVHRHIMTQAPLMIQLNQPHSLS